MTRINPADPTGSAAAIARAAVLLEAVARHSEHAVDAEVPLRCGVAANRLHTALGYVPMDIPHVGDNASDIADALSQVIGLLSGLQPDQLTDPVLDAVLDARAAAAAIPREAVTSWPPASAT